MTTTRREFILTAAGSGFGTLAATAHAATPADQRPGHRHTRTQSAGARRGRRGGLRRRHGGNLGGLLRSAAWREGHPAGALAEPRRHGHQRARQHLAHQRPQETGHHRLRQEAIDRGGRVHAPISHYPKRPETHGSTRKGCAWCSDRMLRTRRARHLQRHGRRVDRRGRPHPRGAGGHQDRRKAVRGKMFIDATGDGDMAANAGAAIRPRPRKRRRVQGMTMMFRAARIGRCRHPRHCPKEPQRVS